MTLGFFAFFMPFPFRTTCRRNSRSQVAARVALLSLTLLALPGHARSAESVKKKFDLSPGPAQLTLQDFSSQAATQVLYSADAVSGVQTNAVKGEFTVRQAIDQLLARTGLAAVADERTGALAVRRSSARQTTVPPTPTVPVPEMTGLPSASAAGEAI